MKMSSIIYLIRHTLLSVLLLIIKFKQCTSYPFILNQSLNYCSYSYNTSFSNELLHVETENVAIYYTLCGYLPISKECGKNVVACLKNKNDKSSNALGRKLFLGADQNLYLEAVNSSTCVANTKRKYNLTIEFVQSGEVQRLEVKNECDYVIRVAPYFQPLCTTRINGLLMDLRPLRDLHKIFQVNSEERNFSLTLCGSNKDCKSDTLEDISACEIVNNTVLPLSRVSNEGVFFNNEKNEISIHGSYKGERKKDNKKFELFLKCNWNEQAGKIYYKKPSQQGKNYRFEMETTFGCVKLPPRCEITDSFFIYNLSGLFNHDGFIQVSNVPNNSKLFLNICGPLQLNRPKNNCSDSFSQVCEISNGMFINRGSISSHIQIVDDVIKLTFTDGAKCKEDTMYSTDINFKCSAREQGPVFVSSHDCKTYIDWYTPQACPKYNTANCQYIHRKYQNCSIYNEGYQYDLSSLALNDSYYEIEDSGNSSIKYILNVCGPAVDSEAPCMKDSMVLMKDLHQINLKYKVKSLGKLLNMYIDDKNIVIKTQGSYCGSEGDYISIITFICSDKEEKPLLIHKTQCTFQFEWKTRQACPTGGDTCLLQDLTNNFLLDLTKSKKTLVNISVDRSYMYKFDLCKNNYTECISDTCNYHPLNKSIVRQGNKTYLDLHLPKGCSSESDFNKVSFELVCEQMLNNEHYVTIGVSKCTATMKFFSNFVCIKENTSLEYTKYDVQEYKEVENCSVVNAITGYRFYISNLPITIPFSNCPKTIFNDVDSSVLLVYSNETVCNESNGYGAYIYRILLQCSTRRANHTENTQCSKVYRFMSPEFCKLFETNILQNHLKDSHTFTPGIIIGIFMGGLTLLGLCLFAVFKLRKKILRAPSYDSVYQKDADL